VDWPERCAVVIPCFKEADHLAAVVAGVRPRLPRVIVVDDGSPDDTAGQARRAGAEVLRHPTNLGKGAALRTGLHHAGDAGFAWALLMDGDGQHVSDDIPAFLERASVGDAVLVVGNRMADPRGMPAVRRGVNRWMSRRLSRLTGQELPDTQCGFRLIQLAAWRRIELKTERFEVESEMLVQFLAAGETVAFVPVRTVYKAERSKIHPVRDTWRWLRWWGRTRRDWHSGRAKPPACGPGG
jgi:glycosyltransferase involved in cell wall biosynthesis